MADLLPSANYGGIVGMGENPIAGDVFGDIFGNMSDIFGGFNGDWLSTGLTVLGGLTAGDTSQSAASGGSQSALNTSGWVVGEGSAEGADLSSSQGLGNIDNLPWYAWAAGTLIVIAIIKKAV